MNHDEYWPTSLLHHAVLQHTTSTRPLGNFPLRDPLLSTVLLFHDQLTPPQQEFLLAYKLIIVPMSAIMIISICSMLHQSCPKLFAFINASKRPLGGTMLSLLSILYAMDIGLHFHHSLYSTKDNHSSSFSTDDDIDVNIDVYTPIDLVLDPFFPVHLSVALTGLAMGLHALRVLTERSVTVAVLLELAGAYISVFCFVLASYLPPTDTDTDNIRSLHNVLLCFSVIVGCVTLQAIGLSCGVSLFHELGIISARWITTLKHTLYFILQHSQRLVYSCHRGFTYVYTSFTVRLKALITRIRSGDRVSRFLKTYFLFPLIPLKHFLHQSAIQTCQNFHILLSFSVYYLVKSVRVGVYNFRILWTRGVYGAFHYSRVAMQDFMIPLVLFFYSEITLICNSIFTICNQVAQNSWYLLTILLLDGLVPLVKWLYRVLAVVCQTVGDVCVYLIDTMYTVCKWIVLHMIVHPVSYIYHQLVTLGSFLWDRLCRVCVCVANDGLIPLYARLRVISVWVCSRFLLMCTHTSHYAHRVCVYLAHHVALPLATFLWQTLVTAWRGIVTYVLIPLKRLARAMGLLLWKYLFAILLICFGIKFWVNSLGGGILFESSSSSSSPSDFSLVDSCGLFLGGYVCLITGSLLLCSKCPPFFKQREIVTFLTCCYQRLDFFMIRFIKYIFSLFRLVSSSAFRSITKFISVLWKAAFDALDFVCTRIVQMTRSFSVGFYVNLCKPLWKLIVTGTFIIWNSPFVSFSASLAVLGIAFYCHAHDLSPHLTLVENWKYCSQLLSSAQWESFGLHSEWREAVWQAVQTVHDMCGVVVSMCRQLRNGAPVDNLWLTAVNQSLWSLSEVPSLGWTLYGVHLCGSLLSISLEADPKVFVRSIMKLIYYPLISSYVISVMPMPLSMPLNTLIPSVFYVSFGKIYAAYTLTCVVILLLEMKRMRSVPDVRVWNIARGGRNHRRARGAAGRGGAGAGSGSGGGGPGGGSGSDLRRGMSVIPSAPPLPMARQAAGAVSVTATASAPEIPFEYLRHIAPPATTFESSECPICMDDLCSASSPSHSHTTPTTTLTATATADGGKEESEHRTDLCLPCGHLYHEDCILEWLREQSHCPSCREQVAPTATASAMSLSLGNAVIQEVFL